MPDERLCIMRLAVERKVPFRRKRRAAVAGILARPAHRHRGQSGTGHAWGGQEGTCR